MKTSITAALSISVGLVVACGDATVGSPTGADDAASVPDDAMTDAGADAATNPDAGESDPDVVSSPDSTDTSDVSAGDDSALDTDDDLGRGADVGGSGVRPLNLVVTANGREIGWLLGASQYSLYVWDPLTDVLFSVNDATGYLLGVYATTLFNDPLCEERVQTYMVPPESDGCRAITATRRAAYGFGNDPYGLTEADAVVVTADVAVPWSDPHQRVGEACDQMPESVIETYRAFCYWPLEPTTEIPTSFELPIEVRERSP